MSLSIWCFQWRSSRPIASNDLPLSDNPIPLLDPYPEIEGASASKSSAQACTMGHGFALIVTPLLIKVAMKIVGDEEDTEGAVKAGIGGVVSNPVTTEDGSGSKQSEWKRME